MHKNLFLAISTTVGVLALAFGNGAALAASYGDTSPLYAGVQLGQTRHKAFCATGSDCKVHGNASGKVVAGFSFAPMRAWPGSELTGSLELAAYRGGKADVQPGPQLGSVEHDAFQGAGLGYRLALRETEALTLMARVGLARMSGKIKTDRHDFASIGHTGPTAGLGLSYALGRHWSVNADVDLLRVKFVHFRTTRVHLFTAGAGYKF